MKADKLSQKDSFGEIASESDCATFCLNTRCVYFFKIFLTCPYICFEREQGNRDQLLQLQRKLQSCKMHGCWLMHLQSAFPGNTQMHRMTDCCNLTHAFAARVFVGATPWPVPRLFDPHAMFLLFVVFVLTFPHYCCTGQTLIICGNQIGFTTSWKYCN